MDLVNEFFVEDGKDKLAELQDLDRAERLELRLQHFLHNRDREVQQDK